MPAHMWEREGLELPRVAGGWGRGGAGEGTTLPISQWVARLIGADAEGDAAKEDEE